MAASISIIIPIYNAGEWIVGSISSALGSYSGDLEVICVDDGSVDGTAMAIHRYFDDEPRVKYIYQSNQGRCVARNKGIERATGEWITFLDADDQMAPNALDGVISSASAETSLICSIGVYGNEEARLSHRADRGAGVPSVMLTPEDGLRFLLDCEHTRKDNSIIKQNAPLFDKFNSMWCSAVFTKIFPRKYLIEEGVRFVPGLKFGEDVLFIYDYLSKMVGKNSFVKFSPIETCFYNTKSEGTIRGYTEGDLAHLVRTLQEWAVRQNESTMRDFIATCCMRNCLFMSVRAAKYLSVSSLNKELDYLLDFECLEELLEPFHTDSINSLPSPVAFVWERAAESLASNRPWRFKIIAGALGFFQRTRGNVGAGKD